MVKKTKQSHKFNVPGRVGFIATIGALLAALSLATSMITYSSLASSDQSLAEQNFNLIVEHERLQFCYENNIRPCDDASIQSFNDVPENKTSNNTFKL